MEIVPDRSVNTDEWPAACVDVARSARPGGTRSRHRRVLCSMSLAAPNSARANFTPISGALAGWRRLSPCSGPTICSHRPLALVCADAGACTAV